MSKFCSENNSQLLIKSGPLRQPKKATLNDFIKIPFFIECLIEILLIISLAFSLLTLDIFSSFRK